MAETNNEAAPKAAAKETKKINYWRIMIWSFIILLVLAALYFLFKVFLSPQPNSYGDAIDLNEPARAIEGEKEPFPATTTTAAAELGRAAASSENFNLLQINLEGSGTNVFDFGETEILALSNIESELYSTKEGDKSEIRAAISARTNKRAYVEAAYLKSGEKDKKIVKDSYPGFNHILVLPVLDPDSVYKYYITATDLNQGTVSSEQYVFYTGAGSISLVDILGSAVQKVFGWAMGK